MREILFPALQEIQGPPVIQKNGIITDHGDEMSLFVYKGRLMYMDAGGLRCTDYFTGEAHEPIPDARGTYYLSLFCENDVLYVFATKENCVWRFVSRYREYRDKS